MTGDVRLRDVTEADLPRIRGFMQQHPEVQVIGAHMALDFYERL